MAGLELARAYVQVIPSMEGVQGAIAKGFGASGGPLDNAARETGRRSGGLLSAGLVGGLAGGAVGLAASAVGAIGGVLKGYIGEAAAASDATDKFKQTLAFAGLKTATIDAATKRTQAYADATVYDLGTIQNTTAQLAANGVKNYAGLTEAAGNLNAVAGGNADTFGSVAMVLTQTAGAGKLTTENYNQLADAIPGASGILQDALKKNGAYTGNFRDAMAKGQITAEEFNKAILQVGNKPVAVEAAKSTKTFEGAIGSLQATIVGGLSKALSAIKPAATAAISGVSTGLGTAFAGIGSVVQAIGPPITAAFASIGGSIKATLAPVLPVIAGAFAQLGPVFAALVPQLVTLGTSVGPVGLVFRSLMPVLPVIVQLLGTLATTLGGTLTSVLAAILPVIVQLSSTLVQVGTSVLSVVIPIISQLVTTIAGTLSSTLTSILPVVKQLATFLGQVLGQALTTIKPLLLALGPVLATLQTALVPIIGVVVQLAGQLLRALLPVFLQLARQVLPPVLQILGTVVGIVTPIVQILGTVLAAVIKALLPVITAVFGAIVPIIRAAVQIISGVLNVIIGLLSGNFTQVWKGLGQIVSGAWDLVVAAIRGAIGIVGAAIGAVVNIIVSVFKGGIAVVLSVGKSIVDGLARGIAGGVAAVTGVVGRIISAITGAVKGAISTVAGIGGDIIAGLVRGIRGGFDAVVAAARAIANLLPEWARKVLGIHSPSRVMAEIGKFVGEGLVQGVNGTQDQVKTAAGDLVEKVTDAFTKLGDSRAAAQKTLDALDKRLIASSKKVKDAAADLAAAQAKAATAKPGTAKEAAEKRVTTAKRRLDAAKTTRSGISDKIDDAETLLKNAKLPKGFDKKGFTAGLKADTAELTRLAGTRDTLADTLKSAQGDLESAVKTRDDFRDNIQQTVVGLGNVLDSFKAVVDVRKSAADSITSLQDTLAGLGKSQVDAAKDITAAQNDVDKNARDLLNAQSDAAKNQAAIDGLSKDAGDYADKLSTLQDKAADYADKIATLTATRDELGTKLGDQLAKAADYATQTSDAQAKLAQAQQDSVQSATPKILSTLAAAVTNTNEFRDTLAQLRTQGIDDTTYSQLLQGGIANGGLQAAQELAAAGPGVVQQVADLQSQLSVAGAQLGTQGSTVLYQAGVDAAQGTVDGIKSKIVDNQAAIALLETAIAQRVQLLGIDTTALTKGTGAQITAGLADGIKGGDLSAAITFVGDRAKDLGVSAKAGVKESGKQLTQGFADGILGGASYLNASISTLGADAVKTLKRKLGIKSPSRVARDEIGAMFGAGYVEGIEGTYADAERATAGLAAIPTAALSSGLGNIGMPEQLAPIQQIFNGPMGYTRTEVEDGIATKARRALNGVNIPKVSVR